MGALFRWLAPWHGEIGLTHKHYGRTIVAGAVAFLLVQIALTVTTVQVIEHQHESGGLSPIRPAAPVMSQPLGGFSPRSYSLVSDVVRIHNQGNSNSCVGQTISAMAEIAQSERHARDRRIPRRWFSPSFIWDQYTGGTNSPIGYNDAFPGYVARGVAPYSIWPFDGTYPVGYPSGLAFTAAAPYRANDWRQIAPSDRGTIQFELSHGNPIAIAMHVQASFENKWGDCSTVYSQYGGYVFWHSMTLVGYSPVGVTLVNSWGAAWGCRGYATISWNELAYLGSIGDAYLVVAPPAWMPAIYHPKPHRRAPFPAAQWNRYRRAHHERLIPYKDRRGRLTWAASVWERHAARLGGIIRPEQWHGHTRSRHYGYTVNTFARGRLYTWPHYHAAKIVYR